MFTKELTKRILSSIVIILICLPIFLLFDIFGVIFIMVLALFTELFYITYTKKIPIKVCILGCLYLSVSLIIIIPFYYKQTSNELYSLLSIPIITDTAGYIFGKLFKNTKLGEKKLCPTISPNKTKIGTLCGFLSLAIIFYGIVFNLELFIYSLPLLLSFSLILYYSSWKTYIFKAGLFALLYLLILPTYSSYPMAIPIYLMFFTILFVSFIGSLYGDILVSKVKRMYNLKDTSNLIPGHGGVWDRLDSHVGLLFTFSVLFVIILGSNFLLNFITYYYQKF